MGDYILSFEKAGYTGSNADRWGKITLLSAPVCLLEGHHIGNNASHLADEGSGGCLEGKGHPVRLH